jgi:hypothetical protein
LNKEENSSLNPFLHLPKGRNRTSPCFLAPVIVGDNTNNGKGISILNKEENSSLNPFLHLPKGRNRTGPCFLAPDLLTFAIAGFVISVFSKN